MRRGNFRLLWIPALVALGSLAFFWWSSRPRSTPNGSVLDLPWGALPVPFEQDTLWVCTEEGEWRAKLRVEIAAEPRQQERGLMYRTSLPENAGMLFLLPTKLPGEVGLWMKNTPVPLDIAYLGERGEILSLRSMEPCPAGTMECPLYPAGAPFRGALEVRKGWFARRSIQLGDVVQRQPCEAPPAQGSTPFEKP